MSRNKEVSKPAQSGLDPSINAALRELAGWPAQSAEEGGYQHRVRERTVHYDANGNVIGATEFVREEDFRTQFQFWGK